MREINVHELADGAKFNRFHAKVLAWCFLVIIIDGYDLAVAGAALPAIMKEMGVEAATAGFMASSALFGMMFGAIFLGALSDKIGRRWTISLCVFLFSVFTAAAGLTKDPVTFSIARFIAGLGIGGVMPNITAQMTEYAPKRIRSFLTTVMFSGYAIGGILAAVLGKQFIAQFGWQIVFFAAGVPVLLIPFILKSMPESLSFLVSSRDSAQLRQIVQSIDPGFKVGADDTFRPPRATNAGSGVTVAQLFQDGRGLSTVMFWVAFFTGLFMIYALSTWLTKLMAMSGYSLGSALSFVIALNVGGSDRIDRRRVACGPVSHQMGSGLHVRAGRSLPVHDHAENLDGGALFHHRSGWGLLDWGTNRCLRLQRPVLPVGHSVHRHRNGVGHWAHGCDRGAFADRVDRVPATTS